MTIAKFLTLLILLDLSSCVGCKDKVWTTLPPETQTGANTFGCMIDGELFVGGYFPSWMQPVFDVNYDNDSGKLYISTAGQLNDNPGGDIIMSINHPTQEGTQIIEWIGYYPTTTISLCREYLAPTNGEVFFTKFDTINKIVSGRFQFTGYCVDSTNVKHITQGRFDLKFGAYYK